MARCCELILDLILALGLMLLLPWLSAGFARTAPVNLLIIGVSYLALLVGVLLARRVRLPVVPKPLWGWTAAESLGCAAFLSLGYAWFILAAMLISGGLLAVDQPLLDILDGWHSQNRGLALVFEICMVLSTLALPLALYHKPKKQLDPDSTGGVLLRGLGLAGINFAALVTAAWWDVYFAGESTEGFGPVVKVGITVVVAGVFLLLWAPPRMAALAFSRDRWAPLGFAITVFIAAWRVVW